MAEEQQGEVRLEVEAAVVLALARPGRDLVSEMDSSNEVEDEEMAVQEAVAEPSAAPVEVELEGTRTVVDRSVKVAVAVEVEVRPDSVRPARGDLATCHPRRWRSLEPRVKRRCCPKGPGLHSPCRHQCHLSKRTMATSTR